MKTSVVRTDGKLTIPARIREALHLEAGSPVTLIVENGRIIRPWEPRKEKSA